MFKRVLLHIGQSKTGTTSLQNFLAKNRDVLVQNGVLYPDFISNNMAVHTKEHNPLAQALVGVQRYPFLSVEEYFQQFEAQAKEKNCDTLLLSAEGFLGSPHIWTLDNPDTFFDAHAEKIQLIKKHLNTAKIHCLLYLREPDKWFNSAVSQIIRYEGLLGKKIYQNDAQLYDLLKPHMNHAEHAMLWKKYLKPARFDVVAFEKSQLHENNTVPDALKRFGLLKHFKSHNFGQMEKAHESLSHEAVLYKSQLNKRPCRKPVERVRNQICTKVSNHMGSGYNYTIDAKLRTKIKKIHSPNIEVLKENFSFHGYSNAKPIKPKLNQRETQNRLAAFDIAYKLEWSRPRTKMLIIKEITKNFTRKKLPLVHGILRKIKNGVTS